MAKRGKGIKKPRKKRITLKDISQKLSQVISEEKRIKAIEKEIIRREAEISKEERAIREQEKKILREEELIEKYIRPKVLRRITEHDIYQAIIGSFFGLVAHFGFIKGLEIVDNIDIIRAIGILLLGYALAVIFLYFAGFRKIKQTKLLGFLPKRATVIYFISLGIVVIVLALFNIISLTEINITTFKQIAVVQLIAVIGAVTADLIGSK